MSENLIALLELLADEDRSVRAIDLTELSDLPRGHVATFRLAWDAFSPARRRELMSALVEQAEANIQLNFHAILRTCLADQDAQVRKLAIEGLWEDEKVNLVQPLIGLLSGDPDAGVAAAAATSLGRYLLLGELGEISDASVQQVLTALQAVWARYNAPLEVRRRVLESLAYSDSAGVREMIYGAYYDEDELLRQSAVFAMGRSGDTRWARFILTEINNPAAAMRFESAVAAGEIGLRQAVQPLIARLDDPDSSVREAAATALGKIGGPAARGALQALLRGPDEALTQAAEDALAELSFSSQRLDRMLDAGDSDDDNDSRTRLPRGRLYDEDEFGDLDDDLDDLYEADRLDDEDEFDLNDDDDTGDWDEEGWGDEDDEDWEDDDSDWL